MSDDIIDAQGDLDKQSVWGDSRTDQALTKVLMWMGKVRDRLGSLEADRDTAKTAIQDLRTRVKALEDRVP